jgi:hypothetical protein
MYFCRRFLLLPLLCASFLFREEASAQTTNIIDLCTEENLLDKLAKGGIYRMECESSIISINLTKPLVISTNVEIIATNEVLLNGQNLTRLMIIQPGVHVTLEGFSFFSGRQTETNKNNGGIDETAGGAIYNNGGTLTLRRARFQGNSVVGITGTPGDDGTGESGEAGGDAAGGAIYNNGGTLTISNAVFVSNSTTGGVGGKGGSGRASALGQNGGAGGVGGSAGGAAIYSVGGRVHVSASIFTNNIALGAAAGEGGAGTGTAATGMPGEAGDGVGAAIAAENGELTVFGSTFVTNSVRGANGLNGNAGIGRNDGVSGRHGGDAAGAAIYYSSTSSINTLSITNSTFVRNLATSGNGGNGGAGSSSGFGYSGGDGGNGGVASGGAIESAGGGAIVNCTFSDNTITSGTGGTAGAGVGLGEDGDDGTEGQQLGEAIYGSNDQKPVILANSIVAFSSPTLAGKISDLGGNITTDRNPHITSSLSFSLSNPRLQPLANNGGPTPTMAIRTNSIALNAGVTDFCTPTDQRGRNRVGNCDIGAFEYIAPLVEVIGTNGLQLVSATNGTALLRWPAGHPDIVLQGTSELLRTNSWVTITNGITETNNFLFFTVSATSGPAFKFYRLFSPTAGGTFTPPPPPIPGGSPTPPPVPPSPGAPPILSTTNTLPEEPTEETAEQSGPPLPPKVE